MQVILPRTLYWKKELPNFYNTLWENTGGVWLNTKEIKETIEKECEENYEYNLIKFQKPEKIKKDKTAPAEVVEMQNNEVLNEDELIDLLK